MEGKCSGPGKSYRQGITLADAVNMFSDELKAEAWAEIGAESLQIPMFATIGSGVLYTGYPW